MANVFSRLIRSFGTLRLLLIAFVLLDTLARPTPGTTPDYESSHAMVQMMFTALAPILFMLLLLDAIMTMVYMTSMPVEQKPAYRIILITNLLLALAFFLYWWPYFHALI